MSQWSPAEVTALSLALLFGGSDRQLLAVLLPGRQVGCVARLPARGCAHCMRLAVQRATHAHVRTCTHGCLHATLSLQVHVISAFIVGEYRYSVADAAVTALLGTGFEAGACILHGSGRMALQAALLQGARQTTTLGSDRTDAAHVDAATCKLKLEKTPHAAQVAMKTRTRHWSTPLACWMMEASPHASC